MESNNTSSLSQFQTALWNGQKLHPVAPLYNMVQTFTIQGALDTQRFQRAFDAVVAGSDILRSVVRETDGTARRVTLPESPVSLEIVDLSTEPDPQAALNTFLLERSKSLPVLDERLFDSALLKLSGDRYVWYLNEHHLCADAWTVALMFQRIAQCYELGDTCDQAPPLPAFSDYVLQEQQSQESPAYAAAVEYWRTRFSEPSPTLAFYDSRPVTGDTKTHRILHPLGEEQSAALRAIAGEKGVRSLTGDLSLFNVFATLLFAFVHRISGEETLRLAAPFQHRRTPELRETPGPVMEVFPLQVDIDANETFLSLLGKVNNESLGVLRHAQPGAGSALGGQACQLLLNYINAPFDDFCGLPTQVEWGNSGHSDSADSLRLQIIDLNDSAGFSLHFDFNSGVFDDAQSRCAVNHFLLMLDGFMKDRERPLTRVDLFTATDREELLAAFNDTGNPLPPGETLLQLLDEQAVATPDRVAATLPAHSSPTGMEERLSYRELHARAELLAQVLRLRGVASGSAVAVSLQRSFDMLVAILAVLKAGGAYVPIEPDSPPERWVLLLEECGARILLTHSGLSEQLPSGDTEKLCVDTLKDTTPAIVGTAPPAPRGDADDPAYILYTSGSTGVPKGVMVRNEGLHNYVRWARDQYTNDDANTFPLFTSFGFDLTVTSIFVPLVSGGRVVIYSDDNDGRPAVLQVLEDDLVDVIKLTPAHLALLKATSFTPHRLRAMIVGGEDLKTPLAKAISDRLDGRVAIFNEYGPTEATVGCMIHRYVPDYDLGGSVPVGRPIANSRVYILDEHMQPSPRGVIGEMYIGGAGLAAGYLHNPEENAKRFIDAVSMGTGFDPGGRLYRTGDLARWQQDGQLEFLGRGDQQVKIRGFRVELGEIEHVLAQHDHVESCVVLSRPRMQATESTTEMQFCTRCGLPSNYPGATFDAEGVCNTCIDFDRYRERVAPYFKTMDDLHELFARNRESFVDDGTRQYDCIMLLSGGKDSTYVLCQLVDMGLNVLAYTLDNGYLSVEAKGNIQRVASALDVDHMFGETPFMNEIFADSLKRHSNVCNGCFKTIYTLSMNKARQMGVRYIVTGLSRGQLFETRLSDLYNDEVIDFDAIDQTVLDARKAYHRMDDLVANCLDVGIMSDDKTFEEIRFVDFYRYHDVSLDDMLEYLGTRVPWVRPKDTGRSTNCRINDVGIYVHKQERGYHNYALPYSWDVRLNHKQRDAALYELDDDIDETAVKTMLREIGYQADDVQEQQRILVAYYISATDIPLEELRGILARRLPDYMIPARFVRLREFPLNRHGKVDHKALPHPDTDGRDSRVFMPPKNARERALAAIWCDVFHLERVSMGDDFFELGGDSIISIQILARAEQAGLQLSPRQLFEYSTIAELAVVCGESITADTDQSGRAQAGDFAVPAIDKGELDKIAAMLKGQ